VDLLLVAQGYFPWERCVDLGESAVRMGEVGLFCCGVGVGTGVREAVGDQNGF